MKTLSTKDLHKAINECKSLKNVENEKLNKIEQYVHNQNNRSSIDMIENPEGYDNYNIEFWFNQHILIEKELEEIANNYGIDYIKIYNKIGSSPKYLCNLIKEIRRVI